jgi:predicted nicotinamide N-methyase
MEFRILGPLGARARTGRLAPDTLRIGGVEIELERPVDPESLVDETAFADDEYLPYWAERWPSGIALAEHVASLELAGRRVLELGCGLGLPSLVAAREAAEVVATDWARDAIALLARNAVRNGTEVTAVTADWREPERFVALGPFALVLAADVLYEERNAEPILALLERLGAPAAIADPGRRHASAFLDAARHDGWEVVTEAAARIPSGGIHCLQPVRRS